MDGVLGANHLARFLHMRGRRGISDHRVFDPVDLLQGVDGALEFFLTAPGPDIRHRPCHNAHADQEPHQDPDPITHSLPQRTTRDSQPPGNEFSACRDGISPEYSMIGGDVRSPKITLVMAMVLARFYGNSFISLVWRTSAASRTRGVEQ